MVEQAKRGAAARPVAPTPVGSFLSSVSYFLKGNEERADEEVRRNNGGDVRRDGSRETTDSSVSSSSSSRWDIDPPLPLDA